MNRNRTVCFFLAMFLGTCFLLDRAYARDVVVLYDTSGSIKWNKNWEDVIRSANQAIVDLIFNGKLSEPSEWNVDRAPGAGKILPEGQKLLDPQKKDRIIIHYFDTPQFCEEPFFSRVQWYNSEEVRPDWLRQILPSSLARTGKHTFIGLAKWSAANKVQGNSRHPDEPFIMIIASDMEEDLGGQCKGNDLIARKMNAFETFWLTDILLSARHKKKVFEGKGEGKYFTLQVSIVSHKTEPVPQDLIPAGVIPKEDDPKLNPPPPDPGAPITENILDAVPENIGEPPLDQPVERIDREDEPKRSHWGWGVGLLVLVGGVGSVYAYTKKMRRN